MLSEINLLPQREQRSFAYIITIILLVILLLIGSSGLFAYQYVLKQEQERIESESIKLEQLIAVEMAKVMQGTSDSIVDQYIQIVDMVEELPLNTVKILDLLSATLPANGFINTYSYVEPGVINMLVSFDSSAEAAQYVHHLTYAEWVNKAEISTIVKMEGLQAGQGQYQGSFLVEINRAVFMTREEEGS